MRSFSLREVAALTRAFHQIATRVGRCFPAHLVSHADLMQEAWVGVLTVQARPADTDVQSQGRYRQAGKYAMLDALRRCGQRPHGRRQREVLVADFTALADQRAAPVPSLHTAWALQHLTARLSLRSQAVLLSRLRGETLAALGHRFHLSAGRVSQLLAEIIATVQECPA